MRANALQRAHVRAIRPDLIKALETLPYGVVPTTYFKVLAANFGINFQTVYQHYRRLKMERKP